MQVKLNKLKIDNDEGNIKKSSKLHNYSTRSNKEDISKNIDIDNSEEYGNKEYTKSVVITLKQAIKENNEV